MLRFFVISGALFFAANSSAVEFSVGRASIQFQEDQWREISLIDPGLAYGGEVSGTINSETKVFAKTSRLGVLDAVVLIRGSSGGVQRGTMSYSPNCKAAADWFARGNSGFKRPYAECFLVSPVYPGKAMLEELGQDVVKALGSDATKVPEVFQFIFSRYANSNGTFLQVSMLLGPGLVGRTGVVGEELPRGIEPKFVLMGEDLTQAVRASVMSLAGQAKLPAVAFDNK